MSPIQWVERFAPADASRSSGQEKSFAAGSRSSSAIHMTHAARLRARTFARRGVESGGFRPRTLSQPGSFHRSPTASPPKSVLRRSAPWSIGWLSAIWIQIRKQLILINRPSGVTQVDRQVALWQGCTHNANRFCWDLRDRLGFHRHGSPPAWLMETTDFPVGYQMQAYRISPPMLHALRAHHRT